VKRAETYEKHIYCLEGNWDKHPRSTKSIRPILELLKTSSKVKYIYHRCLTKEDFLRHLSDFTKLRYSNYSILYFAFHGRSNRVVLGKEEILLSELADVLEGKLSGKIVHFGSCSTLRISESSVSNFIAQTECMCLSGYRKKVEYLSSTAFELVYFDKLQSYKDLKSAKRVLWFEFPSWIVQFDFQMYSSD
jgi:hypothetical protein